MNSFLSLVTNFTSVNRPFASTPGLPTKAQPLGVASSPYSWGVWGAAYGSQATPPVILGSGAMIGQQARLVLPVVSITGSTQTLL
jgi:hypothetical protein